MKKSKVVTIGLLALSIAGCHKKKSKHQSVKDWGDDKQNAYISTNGGGNYQPANSGFPFWFYYYMLMNNGRYGYYPGAVYHQHYYGHYANASSRGSFGVSEGGHAFRGGSTRGGFGSLGRAGS